MCMCVFKFFFEIIEPTEDKVHVEPPRDRGNLFKRFRSVVVLYFNFVIPRRAGVFSGDFTINLARQRRAFSRALKIEKLKAPLFRGPEGAGATNDWCITAKLICVFVFAYAKSRFSHNEAHIVKLELTAYTVFYLFLL